MLNVEIHLEAYIENGFILKHFLKYFCRSFVSRTGNFCSFFTTSIDSTFTLINQFFYFGELIESIIFCNFKTYLLVNFVLLV